MTPIRGFPSRVRCAYPGYIAARQDERNIAHDKAVTQDKKHHGEAVVEKNAAVVPQPGKKPHLIGADIAPSNSVAHQMYEDGKEPRVHTDKADQDQDQKREDAGAERSN